MLDKYRKDLPYYMASKGTLILSWIYIIWFLTKNLTLEEYGEYALLFSLLTFLSIVATSWLNSSIYRHLPEFEGDDAKNHFITIIYALTKPTVFVGLLVFLAVLFWMIQAEIVEGSALMFFAMGTAFVLHGTFMLVIAYLSAGRFVRPYAFATIGQIVIFATVLWLLIDRIDNKIIVIFFSLSASYLPTLALALRGHTQKKISVSTYAINYMRYGLPLMLMSAATMINMYGDQLLIRLLATRADVGHYSANYLFSERSILAISSLMVAAYLPILFRMWENGEKEQAYQFIWKIAGLLLLVLIPIELILVFFGKDLASLIIDPRYSDGYVIIPIVGFATIFISLASVFADVLTMQKKTMILALCYVFAAMLNIVLNYFLIPHFGFIAAAYTTLASSFVLFLTVLIIAQVHGRIFQYVFSK